jgi:integration host factor subunit beta
MIKSELTESLMLAEPGLLLRDAETAVNAILDTIIDALANCNRVEIRGCGAFSLAKRRSRLGRNPRTGQSVAVAAKRKLMFKASREILEALNPHWAQGREGPERQSSRPRRLGKLSQSTNSHQMKTRY